jgi:hypothetical protein
LIGPEKWELTIEKSFPDIAYEPDFEYPSDFNNFFKK